MRIVDLLTRTWVIATVTVVICAYFVARAAGSIIAAETLTEDAATPPVTPVPQTIVAARTKLDGAKIDRNIFCSTCEPAPAAVATAASYTGEPAVLIATMIGREPRAIVRVLASEAQGSWGIGERIPGVGTIDRIGSTSIDVVDVAGHRGTLSLLDAQAPKPVASAATQAQAPGAPVDPLADRYRKIADNDYEVERSLVRDLVTGTARAGSVRAMPVKRGDAMHVRLSGVKPGTIAAGIGLKNSDLISAIDGEPIRHVQQMLDLYAKLDQVNAVELTVTRGGKPFPLTLRLR